MIRLFQQALSIRTTRRTAGEFIPRAKSANQGRRSQRPLPIEFPTFRSLISIDRQIQIRLLLREDGQY